MSILGTEDISISKQDVLESKSIAKAAKDIVFYHEFVGGETVLNMMSLTMPSSYSARGAVQANLSEITGIPFNVFRKNIEIVSSAHGKLVQFDSYIVNGSSVIAMVGNKLTLKALAGEIWEIRVKAVPVNAVVVADGRFKRMTYTLAEGATQLNLGLIFRVNANETEQMGEIRVFRSGKTQWRKVGNNPALDGDYVEVDSGNGYGTTIEFDAVGDTGGEPVDVDFGFQVTNGDQNIYADLEVLHGAIRAMTPDLAVLTGNPESNYIGANPSAVERRAFGDKVLELESRLDNPTYLEVSTTTGTNTVSADTYVDVAGLSLTLTPGEWIIGYDVSVLIERISADTHGEIVITDADNNAIVRSKCFLGTQDTAFARVVPASRKAKIVVSTTTVYKMRIRSTQPATSATFGITGPDNTVSLVGNENSSNMWAHKLY